MTPVEIAALVVSVLLTVTRFVEASKPLWGRLPKWAAVLLPAVIAVAPPIVDLLRSVRTTSDLVTQLIAAAAVLITNLFPRHDPAPAPPTVQ